MLIDNYRHIHIYENCSADMHSQFFDLRDVTHFLANYKGAETKGLRPVIMVTGPLIQLNYIRLLRCIPCISSTLSCYIWLGPLTGLSPFVIG